MTKTTSLRDRLRDPACFPHASRVDVIETHVSWVFLTERDVYKVKKPVQLGFLDFSTLERRQRACEAEVKLNARLAPDVYLGVVPIRADGSALRCAFDDGANGEGEIVDWAVHMRRLDERTRADLRLAAGRLDEGTIDRLAERLAAFHAACAAGPAMDVYGTPAAIARNVEESFAQVADALTRHVDADQAAEILRYQRDFLQSRANVIEARIARGRVRDGHGDLRLEHVYLGDDDTMRVLDCIEFAERFRVADVAADLAFLAMDLGYLGRSDLAERLLATYAAEAGDYDLYAVIDFYESYRAFVRGKIATLLEDDPDIDAEHRARAEREARRYFLLALAANRRALIAPSVTAVGGLIAAGKSTASAAIARELGAPIVTADRTRKQMLGVPLLERVDPGTFQGAYDPKFTEDVYDEVFRRGDVVLASGRPVILDASFRSRSMRARAKALAEKHGVPFRFVECRADEPVLRERLLARERTAGVSDARVGILRDFAARFEPVEELAPGEHVVVDTTTSFDASMARLREAIGAWSNAPRT